MRWVWGEKQGERKDGAAAKSFVGLQQTTRDPPGQQRSSARCGICQTERVVIVQSEKKRSAQITFCHSHVFEVDTRRRAAGSEVTRRKERAMAQQKPLSAEICVWLLLCGGEPFVGLCLRDLAAAVGVVASLAGPRAGLRDKAAFMLRCVGWCGRLQPYPGRSVDADNGRTRLCAFRPPDRAKGGTCSQPDARTSCWP